MFARLLVAAVGLATTIAVGVAPAAPIPKAVLDETPADLAGLHALVAKAVEGGAWPRAEDEKAIPATLRTLLARIARAGDVKERPLPVDFAALEKTAVSKESTREHSKKLFVLAGKVEGTSATDSVILSSGDVQLGLIRNCVVVGKNVRFTSASGDNLVVADQVLFGTSATGLVGVDGGSVLVAGQWIRFNRATKAVCHVLRPGITAAPMEGGGRANAIQGTRADQVLFLNSPDDIRTTGTTNSVTLAPKITIAK